MDATLLEPALLPMQRLRKEATGVRTRGERRGLEVPLGKRLTPLRPQRSTEASDGRNAVLSNLLRVQPFRCMPCAPTESNAGASRLRKPRSSVGERVSTPSRFELFCDAAESVSPMFLRPGRPSPHRAANLDEDAAGPQVLPVQHLRQEAARVEAGRRGRQGVVPRRPRPFPLSTTAAEGVVHGGM